MKTDYRLDYWSECLSQAADEAEMTIPEGLLPVLAEAAKSGHENYDMAFYSPPASDRLDDIERGWKQKYQDLEREFAAFRSNSEDAIRRSFRIGRDVPVSIGAHGSVFSHAGRTQQIQ